MASTKKPVIILHHNDARAGNRWRLFPAAFVSVVCHVVLFGLFILLMPGQAETTPIELGRDDTVITAEPIVDKLKFDSTDVGLDGLIERDLLLIPDVMPTFPDLKSAPPSTSQGEVALIRPEGFKFQEKWSGVPGTPEGSLTLMPGGPPPIKNLPGLRDASLRSGEASSASEAAVARGLKWLLRVQLPDGKWILDHPNFPDKAKIQDDAHIAATALGLLPFLAAGKTHLPAKDNPFDKPIERAMNYLLKRQNPKTGFLGFGEKALQNEDHYAHGLATIALCECYGLTQDPKLRKPAQMAIHYLVSVQHEQGGWRYRPGEAGDLSVSGWQIMALKSGMMAGLDVRSDALKKARRFLDVSCNENEGYSYTPGAAVTPTMTAVGLLCRQYQNGWGPQNKRLITAIDNHILKNPPVMHKKNIYYTYYATQVMHHFGGEEWRMWNEDMREILIRSQESDPQAKTYGSWSSEGDPWGRQGGRLMQTSLSLLTLEVYYRYLPLYSREAGYNKDAAVQKVVGGGG